MTLTRWNPFREMEEIFDRFSRSSGHQEKLTLADWAPTVDISETGNEYLLKVELPEVRKEDVKISIDQGVLTIQGERKLAREDDDDKQKYHRVERAYGTFARSFTLPEDVDTSAIDARQQDGVLRVRLGKAEEAKPRQIEVKVA
jgi:HSP20 family protein